MTAEDAVARMLRGHESEKNISPGTTVAEGDEIPMERPPAGSPEEMAMMQALWADPEFRNSFYAQYGDQLEAMGCPKDGTFPGAAEVNGLAGGNLKGFGGGDQARGLQIIPEPGFVIKTRTLETNEKVFINMCRSAKVKGFKNEPNPQDPNEIRVRIPLSLGPKRNDLDKTGEPCLVYDVVFNNEVMEQALQQKEFKDFLVGLALGWIMEKGGGGLDAVKWTESKLRGNYKGKVPVMQTVRADALIEEVDDDETVTDPSDLRHGGGASMPAAAKGVARRAADNANYADSGTMSGATGGAGKKYQSYMMPGDDVDIGVETPQMRMLVDLGGGVHRGYVDGKDYGAEVQALIAKLEMPRMGAATEADVDICDKFLAVEVPKKYEIEADLPYEVDDAVSDAAFDRRKGVLTLTMPLKSWTAKAYAAARAKREEKEKGKVDLDAVDDDDEDDDDVSAGPSKAEREAAWAAAAGKSPNAAEAAGGGGAAGGPAGGAVSSQPGGKSGAVAGDAGAGKTGQSKGGEEDEEEEKKKKKKKEKGGGGGVGDEFEAKLKERLKQQSEKGRLGGGGENQDGASTRLILGSKEEAEAKEKARGGANVSDRRPFECERCAWRSVATAIRKCKRCHWVEAGSKEEEIMVAEVKELEKFRESRKQDEVGKVDETGGVEDEKSIRAFRFRSRLAFELDVDEPSWLQGIREKHYGPGDQEKLRKELKK